MEMRSLLMYTRARELPNIAQPTGEHVSPS
jgi:hypothetical protein